MGIKVRQNSLDSQKVDVGEIDTSAPFQSVKAALSLFGAGATLFEKKPAIKKSRPPPTEKTFEKETLLHLSLKELNKLKEQLENAETTKAQALSELEKAKRTVEDLTNKLNTVNKAKESAIKATETAKNQARQLEDGNSSNHARADGAWKEDLDNTKEQYAAAINILDAAKQEVGKICQDCEASMAANIAAFQQAAEAENAAMANTEKAGELAKEISAAQDSLEHVKLAYAQARQEHATMVAEKDADRWSYRTALEEAEKKLLSLKKELDPDLMMNLESQLAERAAEIELFRKEMENLRASDLDFVKNVNAELEDAKEALQKVAEEESSLRSLVESLTLEFESVKKEHADLKEKEAETEYVAGNLHAQLQISKAELEAALVEESKTSGASDELILTLQQMSSESENARKEAEDMKKHAEELGKEAEAAHISLEEGETKLRVALGEAQEAKLGELKALDQIKLLSERTNAARASTSEFDAKITISTEEFESLSWKVEESDKLAEMKEAAAIAQVEAVKASENEALQRLEAIQKDVEEMRGATEEALKRAGMAEAAKQAVEGELCRWREREQQKAAEAAYRILVETERASVSSPRNAKVTMQNSPEAKTEKVHKMEKSSSKKGLLPNLNISGLFSRKKSLVEVGSPSSPWFYGAKTM